MKPHPIRPAAGSLPLDLALKDAVEIRSYEHLVEYLKSYWCWETFTEADMSQQKYGTYDRRIGWSTWLLCIKGHAAFFMKGKFPDDRLYSVK